MFNKRGQSLSTSSIILIVLGVVVLVVLIVGFSSGWNQIAPWVSSDNVQNIATQCTIACESNNAYDFCFGEKTLKGKDLPGDKDEVLGNCTFFAQEYSTVGFNACEGLC